MLTEKVTKYKDNESIDEFANSDTKFLKPFLYNINDILKRESDSEQRVLLKEEEDAINLFSAEKGIHFDKVIGKRIKSGENLAGKNSVDIVTVLEENIVLLADVKINVTSPTKISRDDAKKTKDKFVDTNALLEQYPAYDAMKLQTYKKLVVILPNDNFKEIYDRLRTCTMNKPELLPLKIADYYNNFFAAN